MLDKPAREMGVHNARPTLGLQSILIFFRQTPVERVDIGPLRRCKPIVHIGSLRVVIRHHRADQQSINVIENEIAIIPNLFPTDVPPKMRVSLNMPAKTPGMPKPGRQIVYQSIGSGNLRRTPIHIFAGAGVVGRYRWRLIKYLIKAIKRGNSAIAERTVPGRHMVTDLKPTILEFERKVEICRILAGLPGAVAGFGAAKHPNRFRGQNAQIGQKPVHLADIINRSKIGVVEYREREFFIVRPAYAHLDNIRT